MLRAGSESSAQASTSVQPKGASVVREELKGGQTSVNLRGFDGHEYWLDELIGGALSEAGASCALLELELCARAGREFLMIAVS